MSEENAKAKKMTEKLMSMQNGETKCQQQLKIIKDFEKLFIIYLYNRILHAKPFTVTADNLTLKYQSTSCLFFFSRLSGHFLCTNFQCMHSLCILFSTFQLVEINQ